MAHTIIDRKDCCEPVTVPYFGRSILCCGRPWPCELCSKIQEDMLKENPLSFSCLNTDMQTFLEYFASPDQHPLHADALKHGFEHNDTTSMAGVQTHKYTHPKGHNLTLHTKRGGEHSYTLNDKAGKEHTGTTNMHFYGSRLKAGI